MEIAKPPRQYDRVDPAEVQALKAEIERMKPELDEIKHAKAKLDEEMVGKQAALDEQTRRVEVLERNYRGYKEQAVKRITEMNNQRTALAEDKKQLEAKLSALEAAGPTQTVAPDPALAEELKKQETLVVRLNTSLFVLVFLTLE